MSNCLKTMCLAPVGVAALLAATPAGAQATGTSDQAGSPGQLEIVIVTAEKRPENAQNVAMTVSTVNQQQIQNLQLFSFQDIQQIVPGLQLIQPDGQTQEVSLRGIPYNPDSSENPAVDLYWNEVPVTADTAFRTMYDMQQVEVLSGPQGTLRGRSSPAGSILVTTHRPDMYYYGGYVTESISNQMLRNTEFAANLPFLPGDLALRVAGVFHRDEESGVRNIVTGAKNRNTDGSFRETLEWDLGDWLTSTLVHQDLHANEIVYQQVVGNPQGVASPGTYGATTGQVLTPADRFSIDPGPASYGEEQHLTTLTEHVILGANTLTSITGYRETSDDNARDTSNDANVILNWPNQSYITGRDRQVTQELRLQSTGKRFWDYLFGAYYGDFSTEADVNGSLDYPGAYGLSSGPIIPGPPNPAFVGSLLVYGPYKTKDIAAFMDHRFHITSRDQIEVGVRWLDETVHRGTKVGTGSALMDVSSRVPGFPLAVPAGTCTHLHGTYNAAKGLCDLVVPIPAQTMSIFPVANSRYEPWTGSANFTHHFTDDVMAYASYAHSYRAPSPAPATTRLVLQPQLLEGVPETSSDVELGMKTTLLDRRLQVNGDVFYQTFKNFINEGGFWASADPNTGYPIGANGKDTCNSAASCAAATTPGVGNSYQFIGFVGDAVAEGAELSVSAILAQGWKGSFNLSYADSHYAGLSACNDYDGSGLPDVNLAGSMIPGQRAVQPGKNISICNSRLRLSNLNPIQMSLTSEYERQITSRINGYVRVLYRPVLESTGNAVVATTAGVHTPTYHMVNLYFGLHDADASRWDISIWAKNLLNQTGAQTGAQPLTYLPSAGSGGQAGWPLYAGYEQMTVLPPRELGLTVSYRVGH